MVVIRLNPTQSGDGTNWMIALDSERWSELTTWFGDPKELPNILRDWLAAIAFPAEYDIYCQRLALVRPTS